MGSKQKDPFSTPIEVRREEEGHFTVFVCNKAIGVFYFDDDEADVKLERIIRANAAIIADAIIEQMLIDEEDTRLSGVFVLKSVDQIQKEKEGKESNVFIDTSKKRTTPGQSVSIQRTVLSSDIIPSAFAIPKSLNILCDKCGDNASRAITIKGSTMNLCPSCNPERDIADDEI